MIQNDFPEINENNFEENADAIDDYYNRSLNNIVARSMYDEDIFDELEDDGVDITPTPPTIPTFEEVKKAGESNEDCVKRVSGINSADIRQLSASTRADARSKIDSEEVYGDLHPVGTKRDAFRHTMWNALLCKYFWTIGSKRKKREFAKKIADANEDCGNNLPGDREMD